MATSTARATGRITRCPTRRAQRCPRSASIGLEQATIRTHAGLIANFGLRLVKSGRVDPSLGRALNRAHEVRLVADYSGDLVDLQQATWVVETAAMFVDEMRRFVNSQA